MVASFLCPLKQTLKVNTVSVSRRPKAQICLSSFSGAFVYTRHCTDLLHFHARKKIPKTSNFMQWIEMDSTLLYSYICGFGLRLSYWVQIIFHVGGQSPLSIYLKLTLLLITAKIDTVRLSKIWFSKYPSARSDTVILLCSALLEN